MQIGDFVSVFFAEGDLVGKLISDEGDTVTVSIGNNEIHDVPKNYCRLWVHPNKPTDNKEE